MEFAMLLHEPSSVRKGERGLLQGGLAGHMPDKLVSLRLIWEKADATCCAETVSLNRKIWNGVASHTFIVRKEILGNLRFKLFYKLLGSKSSRQRTATELNNILWCSREESLRRTWRAGPDYNLAVDKATLGINQTRHLRFACCDSFLDSCNVKLKVRIEMLIFFLLNGHSIACEK